MWVQMCGKFSSAVVPRTDVIQVGWVLDGLCPTLWATLCVDRLLNFGKVQMAYWNDASFAVKILQVGLFQITILDVSIRKKETGGWQSSTSQGRNQATGTKNRQAQAEAESPTWNMMILKCMCVFGIRRKWCFALSIQFVLSLFWTGCLIFK